MVEKEAGLLREEIAKKDGHIAQLKTLLKRTAFEEAKKHLEQLAVPAGIIGLYGHITYANGSFLREFGYGEGNVEERGVIGERYRDLIHGNPRDIRDYFFGKRDTEQRIRVRNARGRYSSWDVNKKDHIYEFCGKEHLLFSTFILNPPGLLESLRVPAEKKDLLEFLKKREDERKKTRREQGKPDRTPQQIIGEARAIIKQANSIKL